jgi:hypothetical protein
VVLAIAVEIDPLGNHRIEPPIAARQTGFVVLRSPVAKPMLA